MNVAPEKAAATTEFEGKKYFFCAKSCAEKFKESRENIWAQKQGMKRIEWSPFTAEAGLGWAMKTVAAEDCCGHGAATGPSQRRPLQHRPTTASTGIRYTCPMHPEVVRTGPGSCPKCGMALEPMDVVVDARAGPGIRFDAVAILG